MHDFQVSVYWSFLGDPCPQPEQLNASSGHLSDCTKQETFDYFSGSAWPYIVSFSVLGLSLFRKDIPNSTYTQHKMIAEPPTRFKTQIGLHGICLQLHARTHAFMSHTYTYTVNIIICTTYMLWMGCPDYGILFSFPGLHTMFACTHM